MSSVAGHEHAARARAMAAAHDQGLTRLEQAYLGHVASWGGVCWQTDATVQSELRRPDGKRYHVESIARARRFARDRGLLKSERIFMGGKIPDPRAKFTSSRGTTFNVVQWRQLGIKNPMSRAERRSKRMALAARDRDAAVLQRRQERMQQLEYERKVTGGLHASTSPPPASKPLGLDAETLAYIERAQRPRPERHAAPERSGRASGPSGAAERGPPE